MFWNKIVDARRELEQRRYEYVEIVLNDHNQKLDLILDHLKLKYVPETEKKEPAKLVEKTELTGIDYQWMGSSWIVTDHEAPKKKKRGRPKKLF